MADGTRGDSLQPQPSVSVITSAIFIQCYRSLPLVRWFWGPERSLLVFREISARSRAWKQDPTDTKERTYGPLHTHDLAFAAGAGLTLLRFPSLLHLLC